MDSKHLILIFVFCLFSCSPKGDGSVSFIDINGSNMALFSMNELKSDIATIPLSCLVENCEIVQLETNDDAFFNPRFTTITDNYIGITSHGLLIPYILFTRSGKFLCTVGSVGQGPGEYRLLWDGIIDEKNGLIYLSPMGDSKVLVFNNSGKFLKNINTLHSLNKPAINLFENVLTVIHVPFADNESIAYQFNINTGEVLKKLTAPSHLIGSSYDDELGSGQNSPMIFDFAYSYCDTLYHYDIKENKILPFFTTIDNSLEKGRWKSYFQLNNDLIVTKIFNFYDKASIKTIISDLKHRSSSYVNIVNDYYGNLPVNASPVTFRNGYFVYNIQPEQLMDDIEKRLSESDCTENDRLSLEKLRSTLEEDTNNVVFIGKLKQEVAMKLW